MLRKGTIVLRYIRQEIKNIKRVATKTQKSKLDFSNMFPLSTKSCIYGQMTGDCDSPKGIELVNKCCVMTTKVGLLYISNDPKHRGNFSLLEVYLMEVDKYHEHIIEYIKGDVDELEISL